MRFKLLLFLLGCALLIAFWNFRKHNTSVNACTIVAIPPGSTAKEISLLLKKEGIIKNERMFLTFMRFRSASNKLHAGVYRFVPGTSAWYVLSDLISGKTHKIRVTIPEGFSSWQIAERLEAAGICGMKEFLETVKKKDAEGYLFPETYFFEFGTSPEQIIEICNGQFRAVFLKVLEEVREESVVEWDPGRGVPIKEERFRFKDGRVYSGREIVTLSSIIEREAKVDVERPIVSAVFHNRLKKGWLLESCATVQYALGKWKQKLRYKDLETRSPYNTYIHKGLPPGPICNPGKSSIKAAFVPADSDAMYFLADEKGTHYFYTTYREHLEGKQSKKRRRLSR